MSPKLYVHRTVNHGRKAEFQKFFLITHSNSDVRVTNKIKAKRLEYCTVQVFSSFTQVKCLKIKLHCISSQIRFRTMYIFYAL